MTQPSQPPAPGSAVACARHPDRPTRLACSRCRRPMCPDCLREASVGMQCVDCVAEGHRSTRTARTVAGAPVGSSPGTPVVVTTLIVINVLVFLLTAVTAGSITANTASPWFEAAALVPSDVAAGEWWRLLTSGFLHIGPLHIAFNMFALWVIGRDVELVLGRLRFTVVYLVSLLGGSTAVMLLGAPNGATAGASGAVFGLMGALAVLLRRMRRSPGPALATIGINVVISFVIPGISVLGHLGGLAIGVLLTAGLVYGPGRTRPVIGLGIAGVVAVLLILATAVRAGVG